MRRITKLERKFDALLERVGLIHLPSFDHLSEDYGGKDYEYSILAFVNRINNKINALLDYLGLEFVEDATVTKKGGIRKLKRKDK